MKKGMDIHNYEKRMAGAIRCVSKANISQQNKQHIFNFRDYCSIGGIGLARAVRYMGVLQLYAEILNVDFEKATKEDLIRAVRIIQERDYTLNTIVTYKAMLKRFYKWLKGADSSYPEEVKWLKTKIKRSEQSLPCNGDLITEEEVKTLINNALHPRDKAFVSVLYESGARIGEIGSMQIENITIDKHGAVIQVSGKTGSRMIRVVWSTPYLVQWLQCHPCRDNPKAPLWVIIAPKNRGQQMQYSAFRTLLRRLFDRAGINKPFKPHIFRHSRATVLANHLTEFQMNQYFGWIQGSDMPATYVHMSGANLDASILKLNGMQDEAAKKPVEVQPAICPRCQSINQPDAKYCSKCAGILDVKTGIEIQNNITTRKKYDQLMEMMLKDPDIKQLMEQKLKSMKPMVVETIN